MNRVTNESLEKMLPFRTTQIRLAHLMQHLANHSTYHRGQVALMMRQLDAGLWPRTSTCFWWMAIARLSSKVGVETSLLAHHAQQSELEAYSLVDPIPTDQAAVSLSATKAVSPLLGVASYRRAVKHLLTSVVREICTLRSVGAGARATALGHPVGDQQWSSLPRPHDPGGERPKSRLTAYFSGVIVEGSLGVLCSGGFLRCLLFLDAVHKFLRFAVFVRRAIFLFLFHVDSL